MTIGRCSRRYSKIGWGAGNDILDPSEFEGFGKLNQLIKGAHKATPDCYITPVLPCPGDVNRDGVVDVDDFNEMNSHFGEDCVACRSDLNGDGMVDVSDFVLLNSAYDDGCP